MHSHGATSGIEVIELAAPPAATLDHEDVRQWAVRMFHAARVQRVRPAPAVPEHSGVGGARTFYWWMLVGALLALALA